MIKTTLFIEKALTKKNKRDSINVSFDKNKKAKNTLTIHVITPDSLDIDVQSAAV